MTDRSLPAKIGISDHVLYQEIEGECVLLDMATEQYFGLDDVGTKIWQLLAEDGDTEKTLTKLRQVYAADEATLRTDLTNLVRELCDKGLLNVVEN